MQGGCKYRDVNECEKFLFHLKLVLKILSKTDFIQIWLTKIECAVPEHNAFTNNMSINTPRSSNYSK